jgi:outer membrane protein TolC
MTSRLPRHALARIVLLLALVTSDAAPALAQDRTPLSLTLGDAARLAASQSSAVLVARSRADQAGARITQRRADLRPNVGAYVQQAGRTINTATFGISFPGLVGGQPLFDPNGEIAGPVNTGDLRARVSAPLLDLAAAARIRGARAAAQSTDADVGVAAEEAAATAAVAYVRAARARAEVDARTADSSLVAELLGIARQQLASGVGVALDVTRAEAQVVAVHSQLVAARSASARATLELIRAVGAPYDTDLRLRDSITMLVDEPAPNEAALIAEALRARPELRAEQMRLSAAELQIRATRAERLPAIVAVGDDGVIGKGYDHLLGTYSWGVQVSVSVFDGFRRDGRVAEQDAQRHEIEIRQRDIERQVAIDVRLAVIDLTSAREQVDAARARLALAQQEVSQATQRLTAGVTGTAEVITASLGLNGARSLLLDAFAAYHTARIALARAQGHVIGLP